MNPEKRRRRAKRKAKVNRIYRNGGLERLMALGEDKSLLNIEDVRTFGQFDTRFKRIYEKEV